MVNMEETWLYHYDPETKQQSMGWRLILMEIDALGPNMMSVSSYHV
jgi:hypothetical protein